MPGLENQIEGKYDFDGKCMPSENAKNAKLFMEFYPKATFSVGIFKWLPYASGGRKGLKRSKVIYRVRGKACDAEKVYAEVRLLCKFYDFLLSKNPDWKGPSTKSETVK